MAERGREREGLRGAACRGSGLLFFAFACIFARCGVFPAMEVQLLDLPLVRPGMPPVEMPPVGGGIMNGFFGEIVRLRRAAAKQTTTACPSCRPGWMEEAVEGLAESAAEPGELGVLRVEGRRRERAEIPPEPHLRRPAGG